MDRNLNQTVKINCSVAANPIKQLKSEWQKLILFEKFISQNNDVLDAKLDSNDVMYSIAEHAEQQQPNYPFIAQQLESEDENEFVKEKLAYSYLWHSPNLEWWWPPSTTQTATLGTYASTNSILHTLASTANANRLSAAAEEYKPFITLNSSVYYNQKVISKNNQMLIITNDTFTTKPNQQKHHLATASLPIEPPALNDTDYLCLILQSNPADSSPITDASETPNRNYFNKQLSVVTRIAVRRKRRPLLLDCNSLEIPVLLNHLKDQVVDYWYGIGSWATPPHDRSQEQVNQINKRTINISNRKSISVAAELGDTVSLYCTAVRGALMVQFSWRDVKHGQLLGAISHTFVQPSIESHWRRTLNASQAFFGNGFSNGLNNNAPVTTHHQQFLNQQAPSTNGDPNVQANYTIRLHFNPKLPELITAELKLAKVNQNHFLTQFQCLVSNELGSDSGTYAIRRRSVPDQVKQVHVRRLNSRLVLSWQPGFDGGFNQQYIVRFALKGDLERSIQSKDFQATAHTINDLQHPNSVHSRESLNEIRQMKTEADENNVLMVEEQEQSEQRINRDNLKGNDNSKETDFNKITTSSGDLRWRTEQDQHTQTTTKYSHNSKRKNPKKRINIQWTGYLLSPNGPLSQIGNERLVSSNETQIEFTDLKPSTDYYFTVLSKNRLGLAREHSVPILVRTMKADLSAPENSSPSSDQVQSNLQLGENSLGLIEYGLLTNPTANLTIWLLIVVVCVVVLVNAAIVAVYYCRQRTAKLTGSLTSTTVTTAGSSTSTTCTNSTQCTTLSETNDKHPTTNPTGSDENQMESNEKQTIDIDSNELLLDSTTKKQTSADDHCIMNTNNDVLLNNGNVTFTLMTTNPITANSLTSKSNQNDYSTSGRQSQRQQPSIVNNQSANLVYAQLRPDNSVSSNIVHSNNLVQQSNLVQSKAIGNNYNYATINPIVHQLDSSSMLANSLDAYDLNSYSNVGKSPAKSALALQTRINKLSCDYKDKYLPYYLNDNLLSASFEPDLGWDSSLLTDFYSTNASSSLSGKLASSNSLLASCTPSPSTITYSSQMPHLITSSSLTTNTLSPIEHLTPSAAYAYRSLNSNPIDDNQSKLNNYDQFISPTFGSHQSPLLVQTLTKNHTSNLSNHHHHFLTSDYVHQENYNSGSSIQNYALQTTNHHSKTTIKKSPNKSNHCKVVSFQKPVECWMLSNDNENETFYKQ